MEWEHPKTEAGKWPAVHNIGDIVVQAGFVLGPRMIPDYELVYFPVGTGTEYDLKGKPFRLDVPCFVLTRPGESHLYRFAREQDARHLFVHFEYSSLRRFGGALRIGGFRLDGKGASVSDPDSRSYRVYGRASRRAFDDRSDRPGNRLVARAFYENRHIPVHNDIK